MLELLKQELIRHNVFNTPIPKSIVDLSKTIANDRVWDKMKVLMAISEIVLFTSQFRRNIAHWNGSSIPINAISFCITGSGIGKDSSVNAMRRNFSLGYKTINELRESIAVAKAIEKASTKKQANSQSHDVYSKFYNSPTPLFTAPSTNEGFIQYLNELDEAGIGAGFTYSGEFGSELLTSSVITANLQLLSEMYDEGKKEVKVLKDRDKQSSEIKNLPVSAMYVSSPDVILYDEQVKKKFKIEFTSKLARRSLFNYNPTEPEAKEYNSVKEMLHDTISKENKAREISEKYQSIIKQITNYQLDRLKQPITVSSEARELFHLYKTHNEYVAKEIKRQYPISKLVRSHIQWKALKIAGALALFNMHEEIRASDYKEAIAICELFDKDMTEFEIDLTKEPYELFVNLVHQIIEDNKCFVSIHALKKLGLLQGNSNISNKLKDLVNFAKSYDESGVYKILDNGVEFTKIVKTNALGISYLECSGTKEQRAISSSTGFNYAEIDFKSLADMLKGDYAYSPFKFKDGVRGKSNIESGTKWLALDVDKSVFTDEQTHQILANINHHIVRTSDKDNAYKFRVLIELDSYVDLDDKTYKKFVKSICEYLSLEADILPKSQIYFSYSGRDILSVTDKDTIEVRDHLIIANETNDNEIIISNLNDAQRATLISNPTATFRYAYEAKNGEGSLMLYRAAKHARDLLMTKEQIINLIIDINDYWEYPMPYSRLENTIIKQIKEW